MLFTPLGRVCSFCGLVGTRDTLFAGGLGAMMCLACHQKYAEIFASEERIASVRRPPWEQMSDEELLDSLPKIQATAAQANEFLQAWVRIARSRGLTWSEVGRALGISRQAAWERFNRPRADEQAEVSQLGARRRARPS
jgi:hypothetical protein